MGALEVERRVVSGYLYRAVPQSPKLALIQLVTNQLIFYTLLASFVSIANAFHRRTLSLSLLWAAPALDESRGHDFPTKSLIGAYISTAICLGLFFPWTVEKSRKCADFAATVFSMHLIVATVFDKFPLKRECQAGFPQVLPMLHPSDLTNCLSKAYRGRVCLSNFRLWVGSELVVVERFSVSCVPPCGQEKLSIFRDSGHSDPRFQPLPRVT